jgi:glutamate-1-semialdehyde aminotransferase
MSQSKDQNPLALAIKEIDSIGYPEDGEQYINECCHCGSLFLGHKRRHTCKQCLVSKSGEDGNR